MTPKLLLILSIVVGGGLAVVVFVVAAIAFLVRRNKIRHEGKASTGIAPERFAL